MLSKRHGPISYQPTVKLLVGLHQSIRPHSQNDGPQLIDDLIRQFRLCCNLWIQAHQRRLQLLYQQHLVRLPSQINGRHILPSRTISSDRLMNLS